MIYVGIDVASEKHDICIMSESGEIFEKAFQIKNSKADYEKLLSKIENAKKFFKDSNVRIGIESTGVYSSSITNFLAKLGTVEVVYINPVLTNMFEHSEVVHYAKTDKIDAKGICNFLQQKKRRLYTYTAPSYHVQEAKSLGRELNNINKSLNSEINHLTSLIHAVFPEFFEVFPKIRSNLTLSLLEKYPTPKDYKSRRISTILNFGSKVSKGHFTKEQAEKLKNLADNSIGTYTSIDSKVIETSVERIKLLHKQKTRLIKIMSEIVKENCPLLLSIPGIGGNIGCTIYGEIGDISNYHTADALVAFSGINPLVYESGKFKAKNTMISKKGSAYLRNALIQASRIIVRQDPTFKTFYEKKRAEGKRYNNSINHVAKKLTRVIHSLMKNNCNYIVPKI